MGDYDLDMIDHVLEGLCDDDKSILAPHQFTSQPQIHVVAGASGQGASSQVSPPTCQYPGQSRTGAVSKQPPPIPTRATPTSVDLSTVPYVRFVEQPQTKGIRFRYRCEGRSAGSIPGVRNTADNKTYPAIQIHNYEGPAAIVVSCVSVEEPYKAHPHRLVGKDCKEGVCTVKVKSTSQPITFQQMGVQCVKKKEIAQSLQERETIKVDPFNAGYSYDKNLDLKAVRLCFQVFLSGPALGQADVQYLPLKPIVSEAINDRHTNDLTICKLSTPSCTCQGGKEMILLCEKVNKDDIEVRFFEQDEDGEEIWSDTGRFRPESVHRQVAICFEVPPYRRQDILEPVRVYVELRKPSDRATSDPYGFTYLPLDHDDEGIDVKRRKGCDLDKYLLAQSPQEISQRDIITGTRRMNLESDRASTSSSFMSAQSPVESPMSSHAYYGYGNEYITTTPDSGSTMVSPPQAAGQDQPNFLAAYPPDDEDFFDVLGELEKVLQK